MVNPISKEEFKVLVLLYIANIDGHIHPEEVILMLEKARPQVFASASKKFGKMNDMEVLEYIEQSKKFYVTTEEERQQIINDLKGLIEADGRLTQVETYITNALVKLLK